MKALVEFIKTAFCLWLFNPVLIERPSKFKARELTYIIPSEKDHHSSLFCAFIDGYIKKCLFVLIL